MIDYGAESAICHYLQSSIFIAKFNLLVIINSNALKIHMKCIMHGD